MVLLGDLEVGRTFTTCGSLFEKVGLGPSDQTVAAKRMDSGREVVTIFPAGVEVEVSPRLDHCIGEANVASSTDPVRVFCVDDVVRNALDTVTFLKAQKKKMSILQIYGVLDALWEKTASASLVKR